MPLLPLVNFERVERVVLSVAAVLLIGIPIIRILLGYGTLLQLLCVPFGIWCIWQAFFEGMLGGSAPLSTAEKIFAGMWLWIRRSLVGTVSAVFFSSQFLEQGTLKTATFGRFFFVRR